MGTRCLLCAVTLSNTQKMLESSLQSDSKGLKRTGRDCSRLHFGSTADNNEKTQGGESLQVIDMMDEKWWARKDSNRLISY